MKKFVINWILYFTQKRGEKNILVSHLCISLALTSMLQNGGDARLPPAVGAVRLPNVAVRTAGDDAEGAGKEPHQSQQQTVPQIPCIR
jgi:hypothetical protein